MGGRSGESEEQKLCLGRMNGALSIASLPMESRVTHQAEETDSHEKNSHRERKGKGILDRRDWTGPLSPAFIGLQNRMGIRTKTLFIFHLLVNDSKSYAKKQ